MVSPSGRFVTYISYAVGSEGPKIRQNYDSGNETQDIPPIEPGRIAVAVLEKDGKNISIVAEIAGPKEDWIGYPEILTNQYGEEMISYLARRENNLVRIIAYPGGVRDYDVRSAIGKYRDMNIRWRFDIDIERKAAYPYPEKDGYQLLTLNNDGTFSLHIFPAGAMKPSVILGGNFNITGYNSIQLYNGGIFEQTSSDSLSYHFKLGVPPANSRYLEGKKEYNPVTDRIVTQYDSPLTDTNIPKELKILKVAFDSYFKREISAETD